MKLTEVYHPIFKIYNSLYPSIEIYYGKGHTDAMEAYKEGAAHSENFKGDNGFESIEIDEKEETYKKFTGKVRSQWVKSEEEIRDPTYACPTKETFATALEARFGEQRVGHLEYGIMPSQALTAELHEMGHYLGSVAPRSSDLLPEPDGSLLFSWVSAEETYKKFTSKFTPPYRIGRKQKRAILDSKSNQVVVFPKGSEAEAQAFCVFLNMIA